MAVIMGDEVIVGSARYRSTTTIFLFVCFVRAFVCFLLLLFLSHARVRRVVCLYDDSSGRSCLCFSLP